MADKIKLFEKPDRDSKSSKSEDWDSLLPVDEHEEEISVNGRKERAQGVYLLPNLFTTAALFAGFYAIVAGIDGRFESAAIAIFVAMFLDGMDGRVARMTNTSSKFGAEYDSLADMVSFGVAPALVMFSWALSGLGKLGWSVAFIYVACAALRLARFNTQVDTADKNFFTGLASPTAAAVVASMVWVGFDEGLYGNALTNGVALLAAGVTALVALLMIVNIQYQSFKGIDLSGRVPFVAMILVILVFGLITVDPPRVLLVTALLYALSGPAYAVYRRLSGKA